MPQVRMAESTFPLLICDVSKLDPEVLGWNDPYLGIDYHCVLQDIPGLERKQVFSTVHHWPAPSQKEEEPVEEPRSMSPPRRESVLGHLFALLRFEN